MFVVYDKQGAGRVVGVFDERSLADRVMGVKKPYYELFECRMNEINPSALDWLPSEQHRQALAALARVKPDR